jgi:ADP-ribose pyrophosphatase YjhB (NUDIX family)
MRAYKIWIGSVESMGSTGGRKIRRTRSGRKTPKLKRDSTSEKLPGKGLHGRTGEIEVIARGCLVEGSCVLLCRNEKHGYLYLPGGHIEFGESAAAAVSREFQEESGLKVIVGQLALVSEGTFATRKRAHHELNLVFHVERHGGKVGSTGRPVAVRSREEEIDFEWVDLAAIVDLDVRPGATKAWLASRDLHADGAPAWVSEMGPRWE